MARYLTSSSLIENAIRRAMIPKNQVTFLEDDFLAFANDEMDTALIPYVMQFHEDYFLVKETIPLETNKLSYPIPYRAIGNKLNDLQLVDTGGRLYETTRITRGDLPYYQGTNISDVGGYLRAFYLESNQFTLVGQSATSFTGVVAVYYLRPNRLVSEDRVMKIGSINRTTGAITVESVPDLYSTGTLVDIIQVKSPHRCLRIDVPLTAVDSVGLTITVDPSDIPDELVPGDHIALAEECMIPQIPTDLHPMLAQRVAARCLEALGDAEGLQTANTKLAEMEQKGGTLVDSRVDEAVTKVLNRHGILRRGARRWRRW